MRKRLQWNISRHSLFWRYFILLVVILVMCLAVHFVAGRMYTASLRNTYLEQTRENFERNCQTFSSEIGLMYSLPTLVENSQYYSYVSYIRGDLPADRYFALKMLKDSFVHQTTMLRMQKESFFIFRGSYSGATRRSVFPDMNDCFESHLVYESYSTEQMQALVSQGKGITVLPAQQVSIKGIGSDEYLTVLVSSSSNGSSLVIGTLYPVESILDMFGVQSLPKATYLQITDKSGHQLLANHAPVENADYIEYTKYLPFAGCSVKMGIPEDWFSSITRPIAIQAQLMIFAAFFVGLVLCFWFSSLNVQPIRRLIRDYLPQEKTAALSQNECSTLSSYLEDTRQRQKELHGILFSSLLERAFSGSSLEEAELQRLSAMFPIFSQNLCVAVIRDLSNGEQTDCFTNTQLLRQILPADFFFHYINPWEIGLLFADDSASQSSLMRCLQSLDEALEGELHLVCGVSQPFCGLEGMHAAVHQAFLAVPSVAGILIGRYTAELEQGRWESSHISGRKLEQFYQTLQQWDKCAAMNVLDQIEQSLGRSAYDRDCICALLYLLRDTAHTANIPFHLRDTLALVSGQSVQESIKLVRKTTEALFAAYSQQQADDRRQLQKDILQYMCGSFSDSNLCADTVATHFCVSAHFVYNSVQQLTGQSFNKYLLEIRMKQAGILLRSTQENIDFIAVQCGYPAQSTFYRVFKKYFRMTPAQYRAESGSR